MKFHKENIKLVMDVVYNHTSDSKNSNFNLIVPNYYYRQDKEGNFSSGSGCGNETASERFMVRKFVVDSVKHFAEEYKIDGFRFDLMGLHDIETMKEVRRELDKINKDILIYGEGWAGGDTPLKEDKAVLKKNINKLGEMQIAAFSDDIRDAIKGRVFDPNKGGFINSIEGFEESLKFGIVGSIEHKDIDYSNIKYSESSWANEPYQVITYTSAHDNYTLWDKIYLADTKVSEEDRILINKLAATIIFTSQGIAFIHSGDEILRTKKDEDGTLVENSYKSSDYVNKFDWSRKEKYKDVFEYYKALINLRKNHRVFKIKTSKEIKENIEFFKKGDSFKENNIVAYKIKGNNLKDSIGNIAVIFNGNKEEVEVKLDHEAFKVILDKDNISEDGLYNINSNIVKISRYSSMILKYE
jgi:pullulanase